MTTGITFEELLIWNDESARFWHEHLGANPTLLELPCGIGGAETVQALVRHIFGAELRWAERLASHPETPREAVPAGPLDALFDLHVRAVNIFRQLIANPTEDWEATYTLEVKWIPPEMRALSRRKVLGHALFHSQRHWAQLATLMRSAGFPTEFRGDLLFSSALK
jgi:uncharacterized damage-inducible protein DinB